MGEPPHLVQAMGEQDPAIEPLPYKIYTTLEPIPLPRDFPTSDLPALDAIAATGELQIASAVPDLNTVARLCLRSNGLLKRWRSPSGREIEFRAAGCTGARYHLELYLVCGELPGLEAGVYQYAAHDHSLRQLRAGDYRAAVVAATGQEPAIAAAPVIAVWTSTFWRNAWRYQARAYRHVYWDTATALANLLAVAADARLPARVVLGFADDEINALLDVDGEREAAISLVALGRSDDAPPASPEIRPLGLTTLPLSEREIEFPEIGAMHAASSLASGAEASAWRAGAFVPSASATRRSADPAAAAGCRGAPDRPDRCRDRAPPLEPPLRGGDADLVRGALDHAHRVAAGNRDGLPRSGRAAALYSLPHRQQRRRAATRARTPCTPSNRRSSCCKPARCTTPPAAWPATRTMPPTRMSTPTR